MDNYPRLLAGAPFMTRIPLNTRVMKTVLLNLIFDFQAFLILSEITVNTGGIIGAGVI